MSEQENIKWARSLDNEKALLSTMMLSPTAASAVLGFGLTQEDFFEPRNVAIFELFCSLLKQGKPLDFAVVLDASASILNVDVNYIIEVFGFCVTGSNWRYYCEVLREKTIARRALAAGYKIIEAASSPGREQEVPAIVAESLAGVVNGFSEGKKEETLDHQLDAMVQELERNEPLETFAFGLPEIDEGLAGGVSRGELAVVGGETSRGKSVLLCMAALAAVMANKSVVIFSLEMPATHILRRLGSNLAGRRLKGAVENPSRADMDAAEKIFWALRSKNLKIITSASDIQTIEFKARHLAANGKADVVIIDYIQLVETDEGDNREQAMSLICRRIKNLAATANCAVITASQLNDEGRLRESRAIGQHADVVLLIDGKDDPWIKIEKNRRGPRGLAVAVNLMGDISRFEHDEGRPEPEKNRNSGRD